ncbi:MAG TPA: amidase [Gammaproteobacteria bacterium]|nr:amidase [Gammaproteobacteria bacterium]
MPDPIHGLTAEQLHACYTRGDLSPLEVTETVLQRAEQLDGRLNAFAIIDRNGALEQAEAAADRWRRQRPLSKLDGVPVSIKDLVAVKGLPTRSGSRTSNPDTLAREDCPAVARLREAGAVLFGKTHTPEFGWKGITDSPLHGVTRNPWNLGRSPGGSSGGAGAAVAAGIGPLAHGTDAGGSIRIPASYCGLFGIKPTFGRVPHVPNESPYATLASSGPLARRVRDAARMLTIMARPDARDWYALPYDGVDYEADLDTGVEGLRIAYSPGLGGARPEPGIAERVAQAAGRLRDLGAQVEEVGPILAPLRPVFEAYWKAGFAYLLNSIREDRRALMDEGLRALAEEGLGVDLDAYYRAVSARVRLGSQMEQFHQRFDLLVTPTTPTAAPVADVVYHSRGFDRWQHAVPYTVPFNLTGQPAASLPAGFTADRLPVGLQVVGPRFSEPTILRACRALERAAPPGHAPAI